MIIFALFCAILSYSRQTNTLPTSSGSPLNGATSDPLRPRDTSSLWKPTSEGEPSYVSGPNTRGTVGLLTPCVLTLTLCVYTAIHINLTQPMSYRYSPILRTFERRTYYLVLYFLMALLAPELVLLVALSQWAQARDLYIKLRRLGGAEDDGNLLFRILMKLAKAPPEMIRDDLDMKCITKNYEDWKKTSMMSCFFICMGGFALRDPFKGSDIPESIVLQTSRFQPQKPGRFIINF